MKKIGQSFSSELAAAGLDGINMTWGDDGEISFGDGITAQQRDAVMLVYNAHNPISDYKVAQRDLIRSKCEETIEAGIDSDILGSIYHYPTGRDDQHNLNGLVTKSLLPSSGDMYDFWCADANGIWARRTHTKLQIQALGNAVAEHVIAQQAKYEKLLGDLSLAGNDLAAIQAVVW